MFLPGINNGVQFYRWYFRAVYPHPTEGVFWIPYLGLSKLEFLTGTLTSFEL